MSGRCEICEKPKVDYRCAGLDVPELGFCSECWPKHALVCDDLKAGCSMAFKVERELDERERG